MLQWLRYTNSKDTIEALWTENISALLSSQEDSKGETIAVIFSDFPSELNGKVPLMPELVAYVMGIAEKAVVDDDDEAWSLTTAALQTQGNYNTIIHSNIVADTHFRRSFDSGVNCRQDPRDYR